MTDAQKWLLLAGLFLTGWLIYLLAPVLSPFLVAALLAYLGDPVTDRLERHRRISRTIAVLIVFTALLLGVLILCLFLIPLLQDQLQSLLGRLPQLITWVQNVLLPWVAGVTGSQPANIDFDAIRQALSGNWQNIGNILSLVLGKVGDSGQWLLSWLAYLLLVPVVTFYLLRDWDKLVGNVRGLIPKPYEPTIVKLAVECDGVLAEFLRGQLLVMFSLGVIYSLGLWLAGLEYSLLVGMSAGLVSFVPYLGGIVGIGIAGVLVFMQFHDVLHLVYVALVFGAGQAVEGMVLSPLLVGDRIGLHPVAVIFAVMAGGQLFGFIGILLALPVAAVVTVLLRFLHQHYIESEYYDR